jgi:hypothetical protein
MAKANPIQIQKYLKGMDYPARKDDLVKLARKNGAEKEVISVLSGLNTDEFKSPADVSKAVAHHE